MPKPSQAQINAIEAIRQAGGIIVPFPGGYWCNEQGQKIQTPEHENSSQPSIGTTTIQVLVRRGELVEFGRADFSGRKACVLPNVKIPDDVSAETIVLQATLAAIGKDPSYARRPSVHWQNSQGKNITLENGHEISTQHVHVLINSGLLVCEAVGEGGEARLVRGHDRISLMHSELSMEDCNDPHLIWLKDKVTIDGIVAGETGRTGTVSMLNPKTGEALVNVERVGGTFLQLACLTRIDNPSTLETS